MVSAKTPPLERPTIAEIVSNFAHYFPNDNYTLLCKRVINTFNKVPPPEPGSDDADYARLYTRWKETHDTNNADNKVYDVFGKTLFRKNFQAVKDYMLKNHLFSPSITAVINQFFDQLQQEGFDDNSAVYREDLEDGNHDGSNSNNNNEDGAGNKEEEFEENENADQEVNEGEENNNQTRSGKREREDDETAKGSSKKRKIETEADADVEADDGFVASKELAGTNQDDDMDSAPAVKVIRQEVHNTVQSELVGPESIYASLSRDEIAKREEDKGRIIFQVVKNNDKLESLRFLLDVKNIFSKQLPKMPKEYITRLVFDKNHRSMITMKDGRVVGGITYRPFKTQGFSEIAFCAITGNEQVKGYGTRLMNHLKDHLQKKRLYRFLTYADNYAIGYFKKQGFTRQISMDDKLYKGYIKDYDGGTLMECVIRDKINYLDVPGLVKKQREAVYEKIKEISNSHIIYPGLDFFKNLSPNVYKSLPIEDIPGIHEAGWKPEPNVNREQEIEELHKILGNVVSQVKQYTDYVWPFLEPVNPKEVPDYYEIIKNPIDLKTITKKLDSGEFYKTQYMFISDMKRMFDNCRTYNKEDTEYFQCANTLEKHFKELMRNYFTKEEPAAAL